MGNRNHEGWRWYERGSRTGRVDIFYTIQSISTISIEKISESKNIIREVIRKAVDKQGTNKANGKTATGAPAAKVQINPSIDLGPNKRGIGGT